MSTVSRSAALSAAQLLGTVGTAATALTTAFSVIGDGADVMSVKSKAWLHDTRTREAAERPQRELLIANEVTINCAQRITETKKILNRDPDLLAEYTALLPQIMASIKSANAPEQA